MIFKFAPVDAENTVGCPFIHACPFSASRAGLDWIAAWNPHSLMSRECRLKNPFPNRALLLQYIRLQRHAGF